jgi:hypothetical protein
MSNLLKACLSPRYIIVALAGFCVVAAGLLAWGLAPGLVVGALPILGIIACLAPCLLPLYWLRQTKGAGETTPAPEPRSAGGARQPALPDKPFGSLTQS